MLKIKSIVNENISKFSDHVKKARLSYVNIPIVCVCTASVMFLLGVGIVATLLTCFSVSLIAGIYNGYKHVLLHMNYYHGLYGEEDLPDDFKVGLLATREYFDNLKCYLFSAEYNNKSFFSLDRMTYLFAAFFSALKITSEKGKVFGFFGKNVDLSIFKNDSDVRLCASKLITDFRSTFKSDEFQKFEGTVDSVVARLVSSKGAVVARLVSSKENVRSPLGFNKAKPE